MVRVASCEMAFITGSYPVRNVASATLTKLLVSTISLVGSWPVASLLISVRTVEIS